VFKIICSETEAVLQDPSFKEVELSTLTAILEQDDLTVTSELELFNAVQRWATRECVRKGMALYMQQDECDSSELSRIAHTMIIHLGQ
jgi:hypothetical protein